MRRVADKVSEMIKNNDALATEIAGRLIKDVGLEPTLTWDLGPIKIYAVLPDEGMWEESEVAASRTSSGDLIDEAARQNRFKRFLLSRCITRLGDDVEFDIGSDSDDTEKQLILAKLPQIMFERLWLGFLAQRTALIIMLGTQVDDALKKSSATPDGELDGDSSAPADESATETDTSPKSD